MTKKKFIGFVLGAALSSGCKDGLTALTNNSNDTIPSISFTDRGTSAQTVDATLDIGLTLAGIVTESSYVIYSLSNATASKREQVAAGTISTSSDVAIVWDTENLPAGEYYLYADLIQNNIKLTASAPNKILVSHSASGNLPPTVTLTAPNGGENIESGYTTQITWTGADPEGFQLSFSIEYSADSGSSWLAVTSGVSGNTYDWSVPAGLAAGNTYVIKITATDTSGDSAIDLSDGAFIISKPVTWNTTIYPMLQTSCAGASCHSTGGAWVATFNTDDYSNAEGTGGFAMRERIWARVNNSTMPPGGSGYPFISASDRDLLWIWLNSAARE